jgi:hypothetical protein
MCLYNIQQVYESVSCLGAPPFRFPLDTLTLTDSGSLVPKTSASSARMMLHDMPAVMWPFLSMQGKSTDGVRVLSHPTPNASVAARCPGGFCVKYDSKPNSRATRYRYWLKHDRHGGQDPRKIKYIDEWHTRSGGGLRAEKVGREGGQMDE